MMIPLIGAIASWIALNVLVSPSFWATIPIGSKYIGALKIGVAVVVFILIKLMSSRKN